MLTRLMPSGIKESMGIIASVIGVRLNLVELVLV